jgi:hypothetical protein
MLLSPLRHCILLALLLFSAVQAAPSGAADEAIARVTHAAERAYQAACHLRQSTTIEEFETRLAHAKSCTAALSADCQALQRSLPDEPDDPRFELAAWRGSADALLTQARFAELALFDLERAIANEDLRLRRRALNELEGGLRFICLEAADLGTQQRCIDVDTGWEM